MLSNLLADVVWAIIGSVLGFLLPVLGRLPFVSPRRKRLFEFLGLTKETPNFTVYFSILNVLPGGSRGVDRRQRFFSGPAIPSYELGIINQLTGLFKSPALDGLPPNFRKFFGNRLHWTFKPVTPIFSSSEKTPADIIPGCVFTVGSKYYNSIVDYYVRTHDTFLRMHEKDNEIVIRVNKGRRAGETFALEAGRFEDLAIVERFYDSGTKSTVFISAGLGPTGTLGGINYIIENWSDLYSRFRDGHFAFCLGFKEIRDPHALRKPIELARFQES